jgi:hypothetical protein
MTSAFRITLIAALVLAVLVAAEAKGKGPSITHKVHHCFFVVRLSQSFPHPNLRRVQVYFDISIGGEPAGRVTMGLYASPPARPFVDLA